LNIQLVSTICPPQMCECGESHNDLAVAIRKNSSNITCSCQWWQETKVVCLHPQGSTKP